MSSWAARWNHVSKNKTKWKPTTKHTALSGPCAGRSGFFHLLIFAVVIVALAWFLKSHLLISWFINWLCEHVRAIFPCGGKDSLWESVLSFTYVGSGDCPARQQAPLHTHYPASISNALIFVINFILLFVFSCLFWNEVSLCSLGWPGTGCIDQAGFRLLPLPPAPCIVGLQLCTPCWSDLASRSLRARQTGLLSESLWALLSDLLLILHLNQMSGCQECSPESLRKLSKSSSDLELPENELGLRLQRTDSWGF